MYYFAMFYCSIFYIEMFSTLYIVNIIVSEFKCVYLTSQIAMLHCNVICNLFYCCSNMP